jgi:hypothetical protein
MSDPNKDWLDEELESLRDLEAPTTILPKVMQQVRERAKRPWWARFGESRTGLIRSFVLGISLCMLGLLLVVEPAQFFSHVPGASAVLNVIPLLLNAGKEVLFQAKIFNFSILVLLAPAIVFSYILLVATASAIQHLASVRK